MNKLRWMVTAIFAVAMVSGAVLTLRGVPAQAQGGTGPGPIVFASNRSGNYEIYTLDPATGLMNQLTNDPGNDVEPMWSPDGAYIAFASDRDGDYELYVMRADGTDVRQLTLNNAEDRLPRWQPGGLYLVFFSNVNGQWDLYAVSADGATVRQLTNDPFDERGPGAPEGGPLVPAAGDTGPGPGPGPATATNAYVDTRELNVRANPGEGARITGVIPRGTEVQVIARWTENTWVKIQVGPPYNFTGWVYAPLLEINIDLSTAPVENASYVSPPATPTPEPTDTPTPQVIIEFWADTTEITAGECVTIRWRVEGIKEVYYQGIGVVGSGESEECPVANTTYNLRVIRQDGVEDNRFLTIVVN